MAGFADQVAVWVDQTERKVETAFRKIALDAFSEVILRSPVGNPDLWESPAPPGYVGGRFRGNWQVAIGSVPAGTLDLDDATGAATINKVQAETLKLRVGDVIYLVNNLPYGPRLEYQGWSSQAPEGMVRLTVQRWQPIADAVARELSKQ